MAPANLHYLAELTAFSLKEYFIFPVRYDLFPGIPEFLKISFTLKDYGRCPAKFVSTNNTIMKVNNNRIRANKIKWILFILIIAAVLLRSGVQAQELPVSSFHSSNNRYMGFEASFGVPTFSISSDIKEIDNMRVTEEGGSVGIIYGNDIIQYKLSQGFYYSSANVIHTADLVKSEAGVNLYPLQLFTRKFRSFEPYILTGISRNVVKFYGFYNQKSSEGIAQPINYSVAEEPYLGKVSATRVSIGMGFTWHLPGERHFANLFSEVKYGHPVGISKSSFFANTNVSGQLTVNIGISFGYRKATS